MRGIYVSIIVLLGVTNSAIAADEKAVAIQKAQQCRNCHSADGFDLRNVGEEKIATIVRAMLAGDAKHTPKLGDLTDGEIAEISKLLNGDWD